MILIIVSLIWESEFKQTKFHKEKFLSHRMLNTKFDILHNNCQTFVVEMLQEYPELADKLLHLKN